MVTRLEPLLQKAAAGDPAARDELLRDLYPEVEKRVHTSLARDFRPKHQWMLPLFSTSDIVQDVFLGVIQGLPQFTGSEDELRAWIATQVKNRIVDRVRFHQARRRDARQEIKPLDDQGRTAIPGASDRTPSLAVSLEERARLFEQALSALNERERELWRLRFDEECEFDAVAGAMGYANAESARAAFRALRAKLIVRLRRLGIEASRVGDAP